MALSDEILADSPWAYWKLDESSGGSLGDKALDASGNNRYIDSNSYTGGVGVAPLVADGGTCYQFSGSSLVPLRTSGMSAFSGHVAVSFVALVKVTSLAVERVILHNGNFGVGNGQGVALSVTTSGSILFRSYASGAFQAKGSGAGSLAVGETALIGFSHDPVNDEIILYKNGVALATHAYSVGLSSATSAIWAIGTLYGDTGGRHYHGYLDHTAVFDAVLAPERWLAHAQAAGLAPADEVTGTATITLGDITASATGAAPIVGAGTVALGAIAASATGAAPVSAAATVTIDAIDAAATGSVDTPEGEGAASITLDAVTASATGAAPVAATGGVTLGEITTAASGVSPVRGSTTIALGVITASASGASTVAAASTIALGALGASAAGTSSIAGEAGIALDAVVAAGVGVSPVTGSSSVVLGDLLAAATGTAQDVALGSASITLEPVQAMAQGAVAATGAGTAALDPVTAAGQGASSFRGTATVGLDPITAAASGTSSLTGSSTLTLGEILAQAIAGGIVAAIGTVQLDDILATGFSYENPRRPHRVTVVRSHLPGGEIERSADTSASTARPSGDRDVVRPSTSPTTVSRPTG